MVAYVVVCALGLPTVRGVLSGIVGWCALCVFLSWCAFGYILYYLVLYIAAVIFTHYR